MSPCRLASLRSSCMCILGILTLLPGGRAAADEDAKDAARALNKAGTEAYDVGSYDEAIARYSAAYKAYPDARILFNLAQSYRKKGEYARAVDLYRAYLRNLPKGSERAGVDGLISEMENLLARQAAAQAPASRRATSLPELPTIVAKIAA